MTDGHSTLSFVRRAALSLALAATMSGCAGRALAPSAADAVREELAIRTGERDAARARSAELEAKLEVLAKDRRGSVDPEVAEAMPALASVALSSLSTARLVSPGKAELAVVLSPADGLGRFIQITGSVRASFSALLPGRDPIAAGKLAVSPKELRDRYRSGFMGTHYSIEVPIEWQGPDAPRAVAVTGEFVDGLTGRTYPFLGTVPVVSARPTGARGAAQDQPPAAAGVR